MVVKKGFLDVWRIPYFKNKVFQYSRQFPQFHCIRSSFPLLLHFISKYKVKKSLLLKDYHKYLEVPFSTIREGVGNNPQRFLILGLKFNQVFNNVKPHTIDVFRKIILLYSTRRHQSFHINFSVLHV